MANRNHKTARAKDKNGETDCKNYFCGKICGIISACKTKIRDFIDTVSLIGAVGAATLLLAYIAWQTDYTLNKTMVAANRAWLAPVQAILAQPLELGFPVALTIFVFNVGKQPAIGANWAVNVFPYKYIPITGIHDEIANPIPPNRTCDKIVAKADTGLALYPGTTKSYALPYEIADSQENRALFREVIDHKTTLIVEGCFAYQTFGERHTSMFRFFLRDIPGDSTCSLITEGVDKGKWHCGWNFNAMTSGNEAN